MKGDESSKSNCKSLKKYAAEIYGDTLVTGVPSIINAPSWPRKTLKLCILLICIIGFLYQTTEFLIYYYTYPSIVDIAFSHPEKYLLPAITLCNHNGIMRSKFCRKYPDRCETPKDKTLFCKKYPHYFQYCNDETEWGKFKVPKAEYYGYEKNASVKDLRELSHEQSSFLKFESHPLEEGDMDIEGPLIFFKNGERYFSCFIVNFRAISSEDPVEIEQDPLRELTPLIEINADFEPNESFLPSRKPGGFISIHSPFEFINPSEYGHRIKQGKSYKVHIKMEQEELLPYPYQSDCLNYTQQWLDEGRKGPRSQGMCKLSCLVDTFMEYCNCSYKLISYPYDENMCFLDSQSPWCLTPEAILLLEMCLTECKDDCVKNKFEYEVQERQVEEIDFETEEDMEQQKTHLAIYLSDPEVVVYKYRPHYQGIEVFSYIGGYIGIWLGISLVAVVDFMECSLLTVLYAFRRKKRGEKGKESEIVPALEKNST